MKNYFNNNYALVGAVGILGIIAFILVLLWPKNPDGLVGKSSKEDHPTIWNDQILYEHTQSVMVKYGYTPTEADYIIDVCSTKNNPTWCIQLATHASRHETKTGQEGVGRPPKNNLYGLKPCGATSAGTFCYHPSYKNRMAAFEEWVEKFDKYRHKNTCMEMITKSEYTPHNPGDWISNCEWMQGNFTL